MRIKLSILTLLLMTYVSGVYSQETVLLQPYKFNSPAKTNSILNTPVNTNSGASGGFNLGVASIEGQVGFAIGAFAELSSGEFAFVPQANYWNADKQTNFELAGLARIYLSKKPLKPYLDGGLGVNFYNSEESDFTKLSLVIGGGVELANLGTSFSLLFDGKYKLIINDPGNISCFIFTVGMKFPFK